MNRLEQLDWNKSPDGLLPAVVQHADDGRVLMLGYMNREALRETQASGRVTFYSRSRQTLWTKGETSGNWLRMISLQADCDADTLLVQARPVGPVCHLGTATCFDSPDAAPKLPARDLLHSLEQIIAERAAALAQDAAAAGSSYVAKLLAKGPLKAAQKVGEEGVEVALAVAAEDDDSVVSEAADLLFHLLVALRSRGLTLDAVVAELARRRG
jgi:phosphoribosyl-ATP pyrophosphohydrolase/phosphoribosyl-AMP cyclohydrolase